MKLVSFVTEGRPSCGVVNDELGLSLLAVVDTYSFRTDKRSGFSIRHR